MLEEFVKYLIEEKKIVFTDEDIDNFANLVSMDVSLEDLEKKGLNYVILDKNGDIWSYIIIHGDWKINSNIINFIDDMMNFEIDNEMPFFDLDYDLLIAMYLYKKNASALEFGNPLSWALWHIAEYYKVKPDKIVRSFLALFKKFGKTWITCEFDYVNYNRYGHSVGIQIGKSYSFKAPP